LGATLTTEEIFEVCLGRWGEGREFRHGTTYSGHPAACAAALENIAIIERENLAERSREMGEYLLTRLEELRSLPHVGDVAGIGLLARLELVKDKETREPFPPGELTGLRVNRSMLRRGVILRPLGDVMSFSPPLVIEREDIDHIVSALAESIEEI
ncbi:MAG: aminotransferase class III-fold pyridoxal phosphate-dependent enzyme, partial [Bacillota bacterium]